MKTYLVIIFILLISIHKLSAQNKVDSSVIQDPDAKVILDRVSKKMQSYSTIIVDFELAIDNRMENLHSKNTGTIEIKGKKYYMESMGSNVYYDGKTMWSYMPDVNEVTISEPKTGEGDFVDNPALIFSFYNRDFKYRLLGEVKLDGRTMYEIDLYPKDLNQPYSRFRIYVDKEKDEMYLVKATSKDAIDYSVYIINAKYNTPLDDSTFAFNVKSHPKVEVIDTRY